ncbi:nphp3 [Symbiodinium pilosum]|uniref:Nphp3 protein n=1 Tax=Symbiodinium pilosum TaxID=2952 RepID=A0A812IMG0_SYMPI|nr:nphp3 [Symbiodinium pilosum]
MEAAVQAYEEALHIHEHLKTLESPEGATLLSNIGVARLRQRKKKAAKQAFERALSIREKTGTLETSAGATLLTNIADVQELFGDVEGELRLYLQARDIREKTGTLDSSAGAVVLSHIAGIYSKRGDTAEALSWFARAREAREKSETLETDAGAKLLAKTAELLGREDRSAAAALLEEAWQIRVRSETLHSESGLKLLSSLCSTRADLHEHDAAEEVWMAAKDVVEAMGDFSRMPGVRLLELHGDLKRLRGDPQGACEAWAAAASVRATLGKVTGAPAADLYLRLAAVCEDLGDVALSEEYQEQALLARAKQTPKNQNLNTTQSFWMSETSPSSP